MVAGLSESFASNCSGLPNIGTVGLEFPKIPTPWVDGALNINCFDDVDYVENIEGFDYYFSNKASEDL